MTRFDYVPTPTDDAVESVERWTSSTGSQKSTTQVNIAERGTSDSWEVIHHEKATSASDKGWKPLSMTTPILAAIVAFSLLMAAAIEVITQVSESKGGLALSASQDDIPQYAMLSYLYVPQTLAVVYSLVWNWIDLDVKRMQPWFELSKSSGATANDSLFLDYPFDFIAFVPLKAAKRRHWAVFLSGTIMMVVFWAVTPLQSSILGIDTVVRTAPVEITSASVMIPLADQVSRLGPEVLNSGYAVGWLDQAYPPFMAADYALLPFSITDKAAPTNVKANWTAATTKYTTELDCWPAEIHRNEPASKAEFSFLNGQGCNATFTIPYYRNYSMFYTGYYTSPYSDYWLGGPNCPATTNSTHQFLAAWVQSFAENNTVIADFDVTALFCQTSYYKQNVEASVRADSLEPIGNSIQPLAPRELLTDKEFNSTAFEFLLGHGIDENPKEKDWPYDNVIEVHPRLRDTNLSTPTANMVGFALHGNPLPTADYKDPEVLRKAFADAHKYLFSVAVSNLLTKETTIHNGTASSTFLLTGIVVSRPFAAVVEGLLLLIAISTAVLAWFCHVALSKLSRDPSSVTKLVDIFRHSYELLDSFRLLDSADDKALAEAFQDDRFRLCTSTDGDLTSRSIEKSTTKNPDPARRDSQGSKGYYDPIRPFVLRRSVGVFFIMLLAGAIAGLAYMYSEIIRQTGLRRPSENFEVNQIFENYLPTVFATLVEPFWVLLNRLFCVLQPFKDLWAGKTKPSKSVDTTYTSVPPQLAVWKAVRNKHFILAMICTVSLLANVLAIGLSALFNEAPIRAAYPQRTEPLLSTQFNNESVYDLGSYFMGITTKNPQYQDHMYIALANITAGNSLPPWISPDYFFLPQQLSDTAGRESTDTYSVLTRGYGAQANCTAFPVTRVPISSNITESPAFDSCGDLLEMAMWRMRKDTFNRASGVSASEYCQTYTGALTQVEECDLDFTLGWGRTQTAENINGTVDASFAICRPIFETAMFNVTIDRAGTILLYERVSVIEHDLRYGDSTAHTNGMLINSNYQMAQHSPVWHNDTLTRDWVNHLLIETLGSRDIIDPKKPVPNAADIVPTFEGIYRMLFAILLGLNPHLFETPPEPPQETSIRFTSETKIFMDFPAFIITMTVLGVNLIAAIIFYTRAIVFVLPRMPTSIGSLLAYVASSRVVTGSEEDTPTESSRTFSFGRYIGRDGIVHVGIEMDPHVVPIDPLSLREQNRFLSKLPFASMMSKRRPFRNGTWL